MKNDGCTVRFWPWLYTLDLKRKSFMNMESVASRSHECQSQLRRKCVRVGGALNFCVQFVALILCQLFNDLGLGKS